MRCVSSLLIVSDIICELFGLACVGARFLTTPTLSKFPSHCAGADFGWLYDAVVSQGQLCGCHTHCVRLVLRELISVDGRCDSGVGWESVLVAFHR